MIVLTMPPNNDPVIFASTKLGYIMVVKPGVNSITMGAHNNLNKNKP